MAVNVKKESDDSSVDHNYNDVSSIIMDDAIKTEIDLSDNEIVWQTGQDDHGKLVDTNNQTNYLTYDLFAYDKIFCLNASTEEKDSNNNKEYKSLDNYLDYQDKEGLFTIADIIWDQ